MKHKQNKQSLKEYIVAISVILICSSFMLANARKLKANKIKMHIPDMAKASFIDVVLPFHTNLKGSFQIQNFKDGFLNLEIVNDPIYPTTYLIENFYSIKFLDEKNQVEINKLNLHLLVDLSENDFKTCKQNFKQYLEFLMNSIKREIPLKIKEVTEVSNEITTLIAKFNPTKDEKLRIEQDLSIQKKKRKLDTDLLNNLKEKDIENEKELEVLIKKKHLFNEIIRYINLKLEKYQQIYNLNKF